MPAETCIAIRNHLEIGMFCKYALPVLITASLLSTSAPARAGVCDPAYQSTLKTLQTPYHADATSTPKSGKPTSVETISTGGVNYVQVQGKWMRSPESTQAMLANMQAKMRTNPDTCTQAGGEQVIDKQPVTVYQLHNNKNGSDVTVRVLQSSGLLQGESIHLASGTVMEMRYDYTNVQAPEGIK
jgi:hypothetical protein